MNEAARDFSKAIFGSKYRLEVATAVASSESDIFFAKELADALGIADNLVRLELGHLESAGLIERMSRVDGQRMQFFSRRQSPFWLSAQIIADEARGVVIEDVKASSPRRPATVKTSQTG